MTGIICDVYSMLLIEDIEKFPDDFRKGVLTIGKFDGVHLAHTKILDQVRKHADRLGAPAIAMSFDPLPGTLLFPGMERPLLCTLEQKIERISALKIDALLLQKTSLEFLAIPPDIFFYDYLLDKMDIRMLLEGRSFTFGSHRTGNVERLLELCTNSEIPLEVLEPVRVDGLDVSSSRIREALLRGDVLQANSMLGYPYKISGNVITGDKRGRKLGFPTANLSGVKTLIPKTGIYASVAIVDGKPYASATHIGNNPTFHISEQRIEAHLLDFEGNLYEKRVELEFRAFLREIIAFATPEELIEQLQRDTTRTREICRL